MREVEFASRVTSLSPKAYDVVADKRTGKVVGGQSQTGVTGRSPTLSTSV